MPGSRPEMELFEKGVKENSRLSLEFSIPELLIYLQDKQFFEVLYNRIFTDLCLWTPGCPVVQETNIKLEPEIFKMCTSTAHRGATQFTVLSLQFPVSSSQLTPLLGPSTKSSKPKSQIYFLITI